MSTPTAVPVVIQQAEEEEKKTKLGKEKSQPNASDLYVIRRVPDRSYLLGSGACVFKEEEEPFSSYYDVRLLNDEWQRSPWVKAVLQDGLFPTGGLLMFVHQRKNFPLQLESYQADSKVLRSVYAVGSTFPAGSYVLSVAWMEGGILPKPTMRKTFWVAVTIVSRPMHMHRDISGPAH